MSSAPERLNQILAASAEQSPKIVIAIPGANNVEIIESVRRAISAGIAHFRLIGPGDETRTLLDSCAVPPDGYTLIESDNEKESCERAARLAVTGEADVLMKGLVQTSSFVGAILAVRPRLVPEDRLISHVAVFDVPAYHKLLLLTDAAITVNPSVQQRLVLIRNAVPVANALGIGRPRVACIAPAEHVSEKVPSTGECAAIVSLAAADDTLKAEVAGPFGLDVAVRSNAARTKGIRGNVAGEADLILAPNLDTANAIYKCLSSFTDAAVAGIVGGARIPIVLTSRADSEESKFNSIRLAIATANGGDHE